MRASRSPPLAGPSRREPGATLLAALLTVVAAASACGGGGGGGSSSAAGTCPAQPSCPLAEAIVVRVSPAGATGPVPDATVTIRGQAGTQELGTVACVPAADASICRIAAGPGLYDLSVGAPGFETAVARADVTEIPAASGACCPTVNTVTVDVPLAQTPP